MLFGPKIKAIGRHAVADAMYGNNSGKIDFLMRDLAQKEPKFPKTDFSCDVFIVGLFKMITGTEIGHKRTLIKTLEILSYMPVIRDNLIEAIRTPGMLHLAISEGKFGIAELLLKNGADKMLKCSVRDLLGEDKKGKEFDQFSKEFGRLRLLRQHNARITQFSTYDVMHVKVKSLAGEIPKECRYIIEQIYNLQNNEQINEVIAILQRSRIGDLDHEQVIQKYAIVQAVSPISVGGGSADSPIVVYSSSEEELAASAGSLKRKYTTDEIASKREEAIQRKARKSSRDPAQAISPISVGGAADSAMAVSSSEAEPATSTGSDKRKCHDKTEGEHIRAKGFVAQGLVTEFQSARALYANQCQKFDQLETVLEVQKRELSSLQEQLIAKTPATPERPRRDTPHSSPLRPTNAFADVFTVAGILSGQLERCRQSAGSFQSL